ncbi:Winged helix-like DNA-binding domain superfamily [Sesbania bispinosa]|nr:Winged helix-like DNA-binding domain superfamily [Sesbania bispinosa]
MTDQQFLTASLNILLLHADGNERLYQFSDMSLLANESFQKHMNKDPEGYVPITLIASTKRSSPLLVIFICLRKHSVMSADGNKVKRKHPFTEKEKEELQSRTVVAENLPEDHSHQNLQKIFTVVGSVKTIRICHPPESNSSRPKSEFFISNKLYALVEYETTDIAEKAVEKLNDERNWKKGMRVRLLLRCSVMEQLVNRLDVAMFNGILWKSDEEMLRDPISDPISDSKVLPIPTGKSGFGAAAQLKNAVSYEIFSF